MIIAFIIWSIVALIFLILGIYVRLSKKPASFWANMETPKVKDIAKYNQAVSKLWICFSLFLEIAGIPLLYCEQNSPLAMITVLITVFLCIGIIMVYMKIENQYRKD